MLQPIRPSLTLKCHMLKRQFHKKLPNEGEGVKQARVQMTWWKYPRLGNGKNELTEVKSILGSFLSVVVFHSSLLVLSPCHLTTSAPREFVRFPPCSFFPSPFLGFFHHVITNSRANISGRDRCLPTDSNYPFEIIHSYQYLSISDTLVDVVWAVGAWLRMDSHLHSFCLRGSQHDIQSKLPGALPVLYIRTALGRRIPPRFTGLEPGFQSPLKIVRRAVTGKCAPQLILDGWLN